MLNNMRVMGAVVPIVRDARIEGLVSIDLGADDLVAILARLIQYTVIVSIILFGLVTIACFKISEILSDRQELYIGSVNSLVDSINAKDSYTKQHSLNVARYSTILAQEMRLSPKDVREVNILARLHDIGKIGIRDDILKKPSALNSEELSLMRMHPIIGAQILENIKEVRKNLAIIRNHHERFDGQGYPDGLKGEEIPLLARILGVADSFDAMTTNRSYRIALLYCEALMELENNVGTQYDPLVVQAFLRAYNSGKII